MMIMLQWMLKGVAAALLRLSQQRLQQKTAQP
jgi:hypothetical protein